MSNINPTGPYKYQPFGMQDKVHWALGRIWGIGGIHMLATVNGLTSREADLILDAIDKAAREGGKT